MKNIINKVLAGIGAFVIIILVFALVSDLINKPLDRQSATLKTDSDYIKEYKERYMDSCNSDGEMYEYCKCTLDYLFDNYSNKKIFQMSFDVIENQDNENYEMPEEMVDTVNNCLYLIK